MCVLPKASDRLGSDRSPHFKLYFSAKEVVATVVVGFLGQYLHYFTALSLFVKFFGEHHRVAPC